MKGMMKDASVLDAGFGRFCSTFPPKETGASTKRAKRTERSSDSPSNDSASGMYGPGMPVKVQLDTRRVPLVVAEQEEKDFVEASDPRKVSGANPHELVQKEAQGKLCLCTQHHDITIVFFAKLGMQSWSMCTHDMTCGKACASITFSSVAAFHAWS
eukprot:1140667-Pelagomonas_calceolata.AAC.1